MKKWESLVFLCNFYDYKAKYKRVLRKGYNSYHCLACWNYIA